MHNKPKSSHPWKAWNPGSMKRSAAPVPYRDTLQDLTKQNRAR